MWLIRWNRRWCRISAKINQIKSKMSFLLSSHIYLIIGPVPGFILRALIEFCGVDQSVLDGGTNDYSTEAWGKSVVEDLNCVFAAATLVAV